MNQQENVDGMTETMFGIEVSKQIVITVVETHILLPGNTKLGKQ